MVPGAFIGHGVALFTVFVWGMTFISTKILLEDFHAVEILFLRFAMAYSVLSLAAPGRLPDLTPHRRMVMAGAGLTGICLYYLLENIALGYTMASNISVILCAAPLFTAIVARFVLRGEEKLGLAFFAGFVVAMSGICLISFSGSELRLDPRGDILAVIAAFVWAFYACFTRIMGRWGYSALQVTRATFGWGLLFMLPCLSFFEVSWEAARLADGVNLINLLFLGLCASAACFTTWNMAVHLLGTVRASLYIYLGPVVTVVAAALILDERMTFMSSLGAVLTLAGLFLSQMSRR
jgi:drug/metabolite transporter (DMT)-like permease